jgi:hypothetical protein
MSVGPLDKVLWAEVGLSSGSNSLELRMVRLIAV